MSSLYGFIILLTCSSISWNMKFKRSSTPVYMMGLSLFLLIILQGLWLQTEYKSSVEAFSRETNIVFRSTLHQLNDSTFSRFLTSFVQADTTGKVSTQQIRVTNNVISPEQIRHISITDKSNKDSIRPDEVPLNTRQVVITMRHPENPEDSLQISRKFSSSSPQEFRWMMTGDTKGYSTDSIAQLYRRNLKPTLARIPFTILEKEFNYQYPRPPVNMHDSLPYTTSYYPFARMLYAAEFHGASKVLIGSLLPQAGFAFFTTLLIFTSFLFIIRSMRYQQKLLVQKDDFIGNITHELKTPVASVGVALEAIRNFGVLQDQQKTRDYLELAGQELKRLELMADKILKTSVFDYAEEIKNNKSLINLGELTHRVASSFRIIADSKKADLKVEDQGNTEITGNEEHLTQMVYNLIDNALKYASDGKLIRVQVSEIPGHTVLEVIDKGPGIPAEYRSKIFEKFFRVPTGNVHNVKGYGLGLHYVEGVVKHHKGKIVVDSMQDQGCRFMVKLPKNV
jgi:two-component system, OmpR family, phosphate regulon sensor histidine kinase PhoR